MHADEAVRPLGSGGQLRGGDGGGVGGKNGLRLHDGIQLPEEVLLDAHVLHNGFHHQVRVRRLAHVGGKGDPGGDGVGLLPRFPPLLHLPGKGRLQPLLPLPDELIADIPDHHIVALGREDLGDVQTHVACAEYCCLHRDVLPSFQ